MTTNWLKNKQINNRSAIKIAHNGGVLARC